MAEILRICWYNEPILRKKGALVTSFNEASFSKFIEDLKETVASDDNCIGLAAQQVGHALQVTVIDLKDSIHYVEDKIKAELDGKSVPVEVLFPLVIANPVITPLPSPSIDAKESCMSLPGVVVPVTRPDKIKLEYQDEKGVKHTLIANSLLSRCIQHETDHLHGILIVDHADARVLNAQQSKLKRLKRTTRDFMKNENPIYHTYSD